MHRWLPLFLLFALATAFRILGLVAPTALPNVQPLIALFFCGALLLPGWRGFAAPAAVWMLTTLLPMAIQGQTVLNDPTTLIVTLIAFGAMFLLGHRMKAHGAPAVLLASIAGAVGFHLLTNGTIWLTSPFYEKSLSGLWQSLWSGPPGSQIPSWVFLRNLAAANLLFTSLVLLARHQAVFPHLCALQKRAR
jgi:hypothetical protein